jgi:hypothetical protein
VNTDSTGCPSLLEVGRQLWSDREERTVVFLVDGVGASTLEEFGAAMPRVFSRWLEAGQPSARSCFPTTTVTCLPTLGRGVPPAEHGFVGYGFRSGRGERHGVVNPVRLGDDAPPLALGRSRMAGPGAFASLASLRSSFLTREAFPTAVLCGLRGRRGIGDRAARLASRHGTLVIYFDAADAAAHRHGLGSRAHLRAMRKADRIFGDLAASSASFSLVVLADHGMVRVDSWLRLEEFISTADVAAVAGEARAVHLYARPGRAESLHRSCSAIPGAVVLTRAEAVAARLFGGVPTAAVAERLGDVIVTFDSPGTALLWEGGPPGCRAPAQHGGLSPAELRVPLLKAAGRA